ncbi:MAG: hypothetical protein V3V98_03345 [Thermoplasmata archaeon]
METQEILQNLDVDIKSGLTRFTSTELQKLVTNIIKSMSKQSLASLLCDETYIEHDNILKELEKMGPKKSNKLLQLIGEPRDEAQMKESVAHALRSDNYKVGFEVPLPKTGRERVRKVDVAGFQKSSIMGKTSIIGVELKSEVARGAIDKAFGQAKDYSEWCDRSVVCVSPLVYLRYSGAIEGKIGKDDDIGVWIANKRTVVKVLNDPTRMAISERKRQEEMVDFIKHGKR